MKSQIVILVILLFSSCWTYYDSTSGLQKSVSLFDVAKGTEIAKKKPFPKAYKNYKNIDVMQADTNLYNHKNSLYLIKNISLYQGWWIYGENNHFFKDEKTLKEWALKFPNEKKDELIELYLEICEMEYFPMECIMKGNLYDDTLTVDSFEIIYVQGCDE